MGDAVVAVDGPPARELSLPAVRERFRTDPPGTKVRLEVESRGTRRLLTLVSRDLV